MTNRYNLVLALSQLLGLHRNYYVHVARSVPTGYMHFFKRWMEPGIEVVSACTVINV